MIFFYGTRAAKIKNYDDPHIKCENCGEYKSKFTVYQRYAHLFWIPLFPTGKKMIEGNCTHCNQPIYDEKANHYLSMTRTPWYLFIGLALLIIFFVNIGFSINSTNKKEAEYINNPVAGDIYTIKVKPDGGKNAYFFMRVDDVREDSVKVLFNGYEYNKFPSRMASEDYFDEEDFDILSRQELINMLDNGTIRRIKR